MALERNALLSADEARDFMFANKTATLNAAFVENVVNSVSQLAESYCRRRFIVDDMIEHFDGDGQNSAVYLNQFPIQNVQSLYDDVDRNWDADTAIVVTTNVIVSEELGKIELFNDESVFYRGRQNVRVRYRGGYEPFRVFSGENDRIDFKVGSVSTLYSAELSAGWYDSVQSFVSHLETAMNTTTLGTGQTLQVAYNYGQGRFTISVDSGVTLNLQWSSGTNAARSAAKLIGWNGDTNASGLASLESENKVFPVPADLRQALGLQIAETFQKSRKKGAAGKLAKTNRALGAASSSYNVTDLLPEVKAALARYRMVNI
jgi:hypothetical protein